MQDLTYQLNLLLDNFYQLYSLHPVELEKALDLADFYKSVITVSIDGKSEKVVCKDVQFHPVSDAPIHVDFLRK